MTDFIPSTDTTISRRTLAKGAAWAVPAIAIASALPATAASKCADFTLDSAKSCKDPGKPFGYKLYICFTNGCGGAQSNSVVQITSIVNGSGGTLTKGPDQTGGTLTATFTGVGSCQLLTGYGTSSAQFLTITYSIDGAPAQTVTLDAPPTTSHCIV
ncbi:hypothetical protein GA0111570_101131 [Raineyella antarctica]|uniref:Uncharacterized protein n=1 Tax=Raineyella antarctica TaxID=1577474 RepID=A0A1G6GD15_9ACTN|nr:hypothetical protein [Raineyella antarctica]SDB79860.1 hypothetical protein GA0111570_101131 [Raineyella antarctica]